MNASVVVVVVVVVVVAGVFFAAIDIQDGRRTIGLRPLPFL